MFEDYKKYIKEILLNNGIDINNYDYKDLEAYKKIKMYGYLALKVVA